MRKIEEMMVAAIKTKKNWASGNTCVSVEGDDIKVYLHGNLIAVITDDGVSVSLAGFNTQTTRSRITAICRVTTLDCLGIRSKNGIPYVHYFGGHSSEIPDDELTAIF